MAEEETPPPGPTPAEEEWEAMPARWRLVLGPLDGQAEDQLRLRGILFGVMAGCNKGPLDASQFIAIVDRFVHAEWAELVDINIIARREYRASTKLVPGGRLIVPPGAGGLVV